jgi:hypothetical protein
MTTANERFIVKDHVQNAYYTQWINSFMTNVLAAAEIEGTLVEICEIDHGYRIFFKVDGKAYVLRTWDFSPTTRDSNNHFCGAIVEFTLYENEWKYVEASDGSFFGSRDPIVTGYCPISWSNEILGGTFFDEDEEEEID